MIINSGLRLRFKTLKSEHFLDIYTTDTNKESVENVLLDRKADAVTSLSILNWETRAQGEAMSELIEAFLPK